MDFFQKKKHCVYAEVKKNVFLSNAQNQNINAESFAFNNRIRWSECFNPNSNVPMTPKNIYPNPINPESAVIINNTNNINNAIYPYYQKNNNINSNINSNFNNNINNKINNNIYNNNQNYISNNNGNIFPNNINSFIFGNLGQGNIGNNMPNGRYENQNQQESIYNETYKFNLMNGGENGIQDNRPIENDHKVQDFTLINPELEKTVKTTDIFLRQNNPQYKKCYESNNNENSTDVMVENIILNNNNFPNNNININYDDLKRPTEKMLDIAFDNINNTSEQFDRDTGKALNETLGFNINNNNNRNNKLSFTSSDLKNNYNNVSNGNSNQMFNNTNAMGNNNKNNYSRNRTPSKVINGINTVENYWNNDAYRSRNRSVDKNSTKDSFSKTFFMNGNNNIGPSGVKHH